jgi:hypothetical protein
MLFSDNYLASCMEHGSTEALSAPTYTFHGLGAAGLLMSWAPSAKARPDLDPLSWSKLESVDTALLNTP